MPKHDVKRQWEILLCILSFQIYFRIWKLGENCISEIEKKIWSKRQINGAFYWVFMSIRVHSHMYKYSIWIRFLEKWNVWEGVIQHSDITCWFLLWEMKCHFSLVYRVESIILSCFTDGVLISFSLSHCFSTSRIHLISGVYNTPLGLHRECPSRYISNLEKTNWLQQLIVGFLEKQHTLFN